jgi:hypothetical protein
LINTLLATPADPVSEMLGSSAARAAATSALAAASCASALARSGRRASKSTGSPAATRGTASALTEEPAASKPSGGFPARIASAYNVWIDRPREVGRYARMLWIVEPVTSAAYPPA